jgi:NADPH:quinone reductase-like Zn-dependent oxidoreductase
MFTKRPSFQRGEVAALEEGVSSLNVGERFFGLVNRTYAEYVVCKSKDMAKIPEALDAINAAALPLVNRSPGD